MSADLLDLLAELDAPPADDRLHACMPWMATACGRCICGGCKQCAETGCACVRQPAPSVTLGPYSAVTCEECLALGDLSALARASQRPERMAKATAS